VLVAGAFGSFFSPSVHWLGWLLVGIVDAYLIFLLVFAACRCFWLLLDRSTALVVVPFIFAALVVAFASLYGTCDCFIRRDFSVDAKTAAVTISTTKLTNHWEAAYLSLAVITTAAADYTPADGMARLAVALETVSGLLFLLAAFPILAARLALFEQSGSPGPPPDGKFRVKKTGEGWAVTIIKEHETKLSENLEELQVVVKDGKVRLGMPD
jgi:hypothetical protein